VSNPFLGEVRAFGFGFAPKGWHNCDGTILAISQYSALYALLGTQYGGNGTTTFALPDLRGRAAISFSSTYTQGEQDGSETVTVTIASMPAHTHQLSGSTAAGGAGDPTNAVLATVGGASTPKHYTDPVTTVIALNPASVQNAGQSQAHDNMQPSLVINYCIAMSGIYPPRN